MTVLLVCFTDLSDKQSETSDFWLEREKGREGVKWWRCLCLFMIRWESVESQRGTAGEEVRKSYECSFPVIVFFLN